MRIFTLQVVMKDAADDLPIKADLLAEEVTSHLRKNYPIARVQGEENDLYMILREFAQGLINQGWPLNEVENELTEVIEMGELTQGGTDG